MLEAPVMVGFGLTCSSNVRRRFFNASAPRLIAACFPCKDSPGSIVGVEAPNTNKCRQNRLFFSLVRVQYVKKRFYFFFPMIFKIFNFLFQSFLFRHFFQKYQRK